MKTPHGQVPERVPRAPRMSDVHDTLVSRRRFLRDASLAAGAVAAGPTLWRRPGVAATPPDGAHLTFGADPRTQMAVSWMTDADVANPVLDIGLDETYGLTVPAETRAVIAHPSRYHHALVGSLEPGTTYHYRLRHDGGEATGSFRTAPDAPEPFTFTAFGDQGVSASGASTTARVAALTPAFNVLVGDLCYAYRTGTGDVTRPAPLQPVLQPMLTNQATWDGWLRQVDASASAIPWMPTVGNHEMEYGYGPLGYDAYLARFALPANGAPGAPVTYHFRYGNVAVIALDGNDASHEISANRGYLGALQDLWLEATLAALRADPAIDFIIAGFHNCAYCSNVVHASDGGVRERWGAIFDAYAVDLVVNGHNHNYERAHPIRAGAPTEEVPSGGLVRAARDGTTYVTAGGGGQVSYQASLYPASYVVNEFGLRVPETAEWSAYRYLDLSLIALDVTPRVGGRATMTMRALRPDGTELERITFEHVTP